MNSKEKTGAYRHFLFFVQLAVILAPVTLFYDAAIHFRGSMNLSAYLAAAIFVLLNIGLLLLVAVSVRLYIMHKKTMYPHMAGDLRVEERPAKKKRLLSYLPVTVVAGVFSILAALQFTSLPRYDGGLYYDALLTATENFTFTPDSLISSFTFFTHPMQGTSLLIGMGEMLFPRQVVGVYGVTLLLTIIAIYCLYDIFGKIFPDKPAWLKAAGTAVFAFCPYLLGLFSHIGPDYYSLMFFVILIYAFSEELDFLAAFMSLLLVFSKETGILLAASFLIPAILIRADKVEGRKYITKLMRYVFPRRFILYGVAPILFLYKAFAQKALIYGQVSTGASPFRWDNNGLFCFGLNVRYISARMEQFVLTNFLWIIALLAVVAFALIVFRRHKDGDSLTPRESTDVAIIAGIAISTVLFAVFSCLFITTMCPRYNVIFALPASILSIWSVSKIWKNQTIIKFVMGVAIILFLLQNYLNLDPSLSMGNHKINMGYEYIYSPTAESSFMDMSNIGEMYVYNRTYAYYDDLVEKAMTKIMPDADTQFVTVDVDWYETYLIGDPNQTKHLIYWDPISHKRTYDYKREGIVLPKLVSFTTVEITSGDLLDLPSDFYLFLTAKEDENIYCPAIESRGYDITNSFVVSNYLGYMTVLHFARDI